MKKMNTEVTQRVSLLNSMHTSMKKGNELSVGQIIEDKVTNGVGYDRLRDESWEDSPFELYINLTALHYADCTKRPSPMIFGKEYVGNIFDPISLKEFKLFSPKNTNLKVSDEFTKRVAEYIKNNLYL